MCIKYTDRQDPPDMEWLERGGQIRRFAGFVKCGGNNESFYHQRIFHLNPSSENVTVVILANLT